MTQIVLNVEDASLLPSLKQILGAIKGVTIKGLRLLSTKLLIKAIARRKKGVSQAKILPLLTHWLRNLEQKPNSLW